MSWCEYLEKCPTAESYKKLIKTETDTIDKGFLESSFISECNDNHYTCSTRREFMDKELKWQH
jgi:hypothetical protein